MLFNLKQKTNLAPTEIFGIRVKVSARAKRMSLRVEARSGEIVLTWPKRGASQNAALRFIDENKGWIATQRATLVKTKTISSGGTISILGRAYDIEHRTGRGLTRIEDNKIIVFGAPEHTSRRVRDFIKKQAAIVLAARTAEKCKKLNLKPSPVRIIDPKTRWGSCAPDGRIMFSWRLMLSPDNVLDYVVAHEVAHLVHMNHSRKFWALCLTLCQDGVASRRWLKKNGAELMAYR